MDGISVTDADLWFRTLTAIELARLADILALVSSLRTVPSLANLISCLELSPGGTLQARVTLLRSMSYFKNVVLIDGYTDVLPAMSAGYSTG